MDALGKGIIEHFDSRFRGSAKWLDYWNNLLGQTFNGLVMDPEYGASKAELSRWTMDDLALVMPQSPACRVSRRLDNREHADGARLVFHLIERGHGRLTQRGRTVEVSPGDAVMCAAEEHYEFDFYTPHQVSIIDAPRTSLTLSDDEIEAAIATKVSIRQVNTRVLQSFVRSLWSEAGSAAEQESMGQYRPILLEMIGMALKSEDAGSADGRRKCGSQLLVTMDRVVDARLHDPDLSPAVLAQELGVSLRKLQAAVSTRGTTPREIICRRRIERAARRLVLEPEVRIGSIAFDCGYQDTAHFSRRFRALLGCSPAQYRQKH
ncbi:AraC family transcriptional regulator [Altererythrobacter sp.]|uniref:AraC family transcriptional regulator n=1 Tax=Altererythrobacter sp. TaxID=1872480 RepID=UPI003D03D824